MLPLGRRLRRAIIPPLVRLVGRVAYRNPGLSAKLLPLWRTDDVSVTGADEKGLVSPAGGDQVTAGPSDDDELPVPPRHLWEGYAETPEKYLAGGREHVGRMIDVLRSRGSPVPLRRVLDLGCASGRMLRFLPRDGAAEHWGLDINANHIAWCQEHLSPPMLFATNTTVPHLPFEDGYFDLVYCGSVFTHIAELADAWLLELRRVLQPGGCAFITVHSRRTLDLLLTTYRDAPLFREFAEMVARHEAAHRLRSRAWSSFAIGADPYSQVFYDVDRLRARWGRIMPVLDIVEEAHDYQAAVVLRKGA